MSTVKTRLNELIKELGFNKNEFAREVGISSAVISKITVKEVNFGIDIYKKIVDRYPSLNQQWLLNGEGNMWLNTQAQEPSLNPSLNDGIVKNDEKINYGWATGDLNKSTLMQQFIEVLAKGSFLDNFKGDNKTTYYYRHPQNQLNLILKNVTGTFQDAYENYYKLIDLAIKLGAPDWFEEKFPTAEMPFKAFLKQFNEDLKDEHEDVTDKKLLQCIKIVEYENTAENYRDSLTKLINYIDRYVDLFSHQEHKTAINH